MGNDPFEERALTIPATLLEKPRLSVEECVSRYSFIVTMDNGEKIEIPHDVFVKRLYPLWRAQMGFDQ